MFMIPYANKKNAKQVVPLETEIKLYDNCAVITLSAKVSECHCFRYTIKDT